MWLLGHWDAERFFQSGMSEVLSIQRLKEGKVSAPVEQGRSAETYTAGEIAQAIGSLTAAQKTALVKIAKAYAWKTRYDHEDLIQEALTRVLEGKRTWPRGLSAEVFLRGVMRSIASDWGPEELDDRVDVDDIGYVNHSAAARIDAQKMLALFGDDPAAQKVFVAMLEGARGEELREISGLSAKDYETKRTKMRRRLEKMMSQPTRGREP
jgi:DNA-directed RNA polymerase specialized sigma24 family protein